LVADVAEAIIGAAFLTGGREAALRVTKILKLIPPEPSASGITMFAEWADFGRHALLPAEVVTVQLRAETVQEVEKTIGHGFSFGSRSHLLAQALVSSANLLTRSKPFHHTC
jgi:endoribonuclease Dicer